MIDIRRCSVDELTAAPNFAQILSEYAMESSIAEVGPANAQLEMYRKLEASGMFHPIGAFRDGMLVGFVLPIVMVLPHYGVVGAAIESFFVTQPERQTGVGLRLLAKAEELAVSLGAKALLLSAPVDSRLAQVLRKHNKYRHSNDVFVRALA